MLTRTELFYYCILSVLILLWTCQLVACHLTHSLIILTESYINLYRILDISVGILHLRTQKLIAKHRDKRINGPHAEPAEGHQTVAGKLFNSVCTYQFKRLPLLGSFVNGLFLAALLMSAAIEGIQTCFHSGHSLGHEQKSILEQHPLTYPTILVGFALVGLVMQYCSLWAHEMREEELCSASLTDLAAPSLADGVAGWSKHTRGSLGHGSTRDENGQQTVIAIRELNASSLVQTAQVSLKPARPLGGGGGSGARQSYDLNSTPGGRSSPAASIGHSPGCGSPGELPLTIRSQEIAHDEDEAANRISLKSLKFSLNLESARSPEVPAIRSISGGNCAEWHAGQLAHKANASVVAPVHRDNWFLVRYLASPLALVACASIVYFAHDELATEVADAVLAVTVVALLFAASYPPMKRAGRVLLQTVPDGVNLARLKRDLESCSALVLEARDLHVWSVTPRSNRVATCSLVLNKRLIGSEQQVRDILAEAKYKFLDQNIKCTTIEPLLEDLQQEAAIN